MYELFQAVLTSEEKTDLSHFLLSLDHIEQRYLLRNEILQAFANYCHQSQKPAYFYHSSSLGTLIHYTHEIILEQDNTWFIVRPRIASQEVWRLTADFTSCDLMTSKEFLDVSDRLVNLSQPHILEIDLHPFYQASPRITDPRNIGQGLTFLNHYLCNQFVTAPQYWLEQLFQALQGIEYNGMRLLVSDRISSGIQFAKQIKPAIRFLSELPPDAPYEKFHLHLQELGLEAGWGNNAARVRETLELLQRLIDTPQPAILEAFVARIPAVFRVVLVSIHGWVAQEDVLGRDETLGQVIYVLEQARSLENKLQEEIKLAGLDIFGIKPHVIILTRLIPNCGSTFCDLRLEKVHNTENAWILRVPFQDFDSEITNNWISKFEIWPYLERFAEDAEKELLAQFQGKPNLIIGNYTDGNLVAFLLSRSLKVTQCNIAHSLEKPKHLFSNLYWQDLEDKYHFSAQFTADLISMNAADFIVASSYQEIIGTPDTMGQYESYKCFTMPQLYHVIDGIDLFNPKFNMVPPGVSETCFFPYSQKEQRNPQESQQIQDLLFQKRDDHILGYLDDVQKRPIFAVAPITSIKNLTGLTECFGKNQELQTRCNLILLSSKLYADEATDLEEAREIQKLHNLINEYHLYGKIRWLGMRLPSRKIGEAYRIIADYQGIYIHFALYEAFGRSILEAMISGLPTFATKFGGSLEIIENWQNGFHLNPTDLEGTAKTIINFLNRCEANPEYWTETSQWMIERIRHKYNWKSHTEQLLLLAKTFSFWNFIAPEDNDARDRYMETLFYLIYRPRAEKILTQHQKRYAPI
ncbi:sucrose synthase [Sphaerospermopsis aphanizomenoides BCCUSP55]|uniref:sucrose synthase n=1 Tax=Sphaerospermopsis aphanizomenoides TaxID=459663 RepID=UPI001907BB18|nr:sucrose synthase [Sphaerospermopsis aphanizomenoides]MBK1986262.1 sucrose synthase [Sphaerospermopsis aphanizomenoides BCCUSP55]